METALITGANRGLGLGLTGEFLDRGWRVIAGCRDPQSSRALQALSRQFQGACEVWPVDVARPVATRELAERLERGQVTLDLLVNNAGQHPEPRGQGLNQADPEAVLATLNVNAVGALRIICAVLPALRRSARPRIVNISSGAGSLKAPSRKAHYAYSISKAAMNMITRRVALDLDPEGVTVVSVSPGWVRTDMGGTDAELALEEVIPALADTFSKLAPSDSGSWIDRFGQPSDFAW